MPLRSRGDGIETIERLAAFDRGDGAARVDARGIDDAAVMARRDADDLPGEVETIGGLAEQLDEAPRDVAEPDQDQRELGLVHRDAGDDG